MIRETFKFWDLVCLILDTLRYFRDACKQTPSQKSLPPLAGGWPLTQLNYLFPLGTKCCVLTLLNIIPKFPKEKYQFLSHLSIKSSRFFCVPYVWLLWDTKCFLKTLLIKKMVYVMNRSQRGKQWQRLFDAEWLISWKSTQHSHNLTQSPSKSLCHSSSFWRRFVTYAIFLLTKFSRKHSVSLSNHAYGTHKCARFWW